MALASSLDAFKHEDAESAYPAHGYDRVTKFSKVSLFSGLNQLEDLVYSPSDWF